MSVATETIDELLAEFPFADDGRSKAVAVSAMVGLFAAGLLGTGMSATTSACVWTHAMNNAIQEAKRRLPLPALMHRLGLGEHAKKSARCPFHDDKHNSFSVWQRQDGSWRFKCHAGCGEGDEITFLEVQKRISNSGATKLFLEMASANDATSLTSKLASTPAFDWGACVEAFTQKDILRLIMQRGYSRGLCSWLKQNGLIGIYKGCFAFPVHDRAGKVVAVHYRLRDGSWRYFPQGAQVRPLVIGKLVAGNPVHVFESQWCAFAFMDASGERSGIIITRGASNGALVAGLIPENSTVYVWTQNDAAGEKWEKDICANTKAVVKRAKIPATHKDLNEWTCAGATDRELSRPVFIYLANAEGAGKTLIAKCAISPTHGLVKTDGDLKDKAETAKELLAAVIEARPYILFDNCKRHLDSPYLEAFVSSTMWSGRILGVSKMFAGENLMTVFVTGNGCTVSPDMRRRALFVELFMENERAEDRKFKRVLDDAALLALRPGILAALWALVREWDAAGRPEPTRTHTAFPRWAEIIGGIVELAEYGCPLATAEIPSAADVDGADMRELVKLLAGGEPLKFDELVCLARDNGLFERIIGSDDGELKPSDKSTFGKLLKRYDRRVFSVGRSFVIDGKGRYKTFRVAGG